ncbi:MAG: PDZ domain-containing protein [Saprospiraceae bacterium]|nr:PDZ domain-containing protein [Saprospiraceae bacterium]
MRYLTLVFILSASLGVLPQKLFAREAAYIGIHSETISKQKAKILGFTNCYGSYITRVIPGSPAQKAGLMPFDYIFAIDKDNTREEMRLTQILAKYRPNDEAVVHFMRHGKVKKETVVFSSKSFGVTVISSEKKAFLGVSPDDNEDERNEKAGVVIKVVANSTATDMGLQNGDRIMDINGYPMVDWTDISTAVGMLSAGDAVTIQYERSGKRNTAKTNIKSYEESKTKTEYTWIAKPEESAFLGISSNSISKEKAATLGFDNTYGSYVTEIIPGAAAQKAGLQPFDYVYGIDQHRTGPDADLTTLLKKYKAGDKATVHYVRQGKPATAELTFSSRKDAKAIAQDRCDKAFFGVSELYRAEKSTQRGVQVEIVANSTAEAMGMQNGDIIMQINGYPIVDWNDISAAVSNMKVGAEVRVLYRRGNTEIESTLPIKSLCDTKGKEESVWDIKFDWDDLPGIRRENAGAPEAGFEPVNMKSVVAGIQNVEAAEMGELQSRMRGITLSTANDLTLEDLQLQPNPAIGRFGLQFRLPESGITAVRIFNSAGRLIYEYELGVFSGAFSDDVDISQNGAGNYYLEVRQDDRSTVKKIILQN